jgi:hypothetical protein
VTSGAAPGGWPSAAGPPPRPLVQPAPVQPSPVPLAEAQPGQWVGRQWVPPHWQAVAPTRPSRLWPHWLVQSLATLVILISGAGFFAFQHFTGEQTATWVRGALVADPPPAPRDSSQTWTDWARRAASQAIQVQGKALLAGDEKTFLAVADPANAGLVNDLARRYKTLQAMGPGVWTQSMSGSFVSNGGRRWSVDIKTSYCFGDPSCRPIQLLAGSEWGVSGKRLVLTRLEATNTRWNGPRPWENDALTVQTGDRVVIGMAKFAPSRLPGDVAVLADKAARVADIFAKWDDPPVRYVILFAGPEEWKEWYGGDQPDWAAAFAVEVSSVAREIVVLANHAYRDKPDVLQFLLTHELTHASSLAGKGDGANAQAWWLVEGLADYAAMLDLKISEYDGLTPTGSFVRNRWNGDPAVTRPTASASDSEAAGRYGVAFLAVRGLAQKYGLEKTLNFFGRVVHDGETVNEAAPLAFGASWPSVRSSAASFIRASVD